MSGQYIARNPSFFINEIDFLTNLFHKGSVFLSPTFFSGSHKRIKNVESIYKSNMCLVKLYDITLHYLQVAGQF